MDFVHVGCLGEGLLVLLWPVVNFWGCFEEMEDFGYGDFGFGVVGHE